MPVIMLTLEEVLDSEYVSETITGHRRWVNEVERVFKYSDGKHYKANYDRAATEQQEGSGTELDETLQCVEVWKVLVPTWIWEEIK